MKVTANKSDLDQMVLREAFGCFPSGVTAFCGMVSGKPEGIAASSFTSVSLDPALVSVSVAHTSSTWPKLADLDRLGLSVLSDDHGPVARALSSKADDRFAGIDWHATESGAVFVEGAALSLECAPYDTINAGDHKIVLMEVVGLTMSTSIEPIVFHRSAFRHLNAG
ncbi:flavin reductase family protein [Rhodococcus sp. NPDC057529]|uniref:flavin reductase family protein n=1 Tax=Rhodococcus sp. NPDC057529 TaxID=3346158 RepID=UPI00366F2DA8